MSTWLSGRSGVGRVLAALVATAAVSLSAACAGPSGPGQTTPTEAGTVAPGDTPAPTVGYFVSGGLKPMGDEVTVSPDGKAVLKTYGKEVARCTLVDPQATSIRELAQQANLQAVAPSPKPSRGTGADMRVSGLLYGDVRVESDRAKTAAEPWPSLLTSLRAVYADLVNIRGTGSPTSTNPMCR